MNPEEGGVEEFWERDVSITIKDGIRWAVLHFKDGHFLRCDYEGLRGSGGYSLEDWYFLNLVSSRIIDLSKEEVK